MISFDFYKNRSYLNNEFKEPKYDESTGMSLEEMEENLRKMFLENFDVLASVTLRAKMFAYIYDHAQIEINPYNLFAGKANMGLFMRKEGAKLFKKSVLEKYSPETLELQASAKECASAPGVDYHHTLPDWNDIVHLGFWGILDRALKRKEQLETDPEASEEQKLFIDSVITVYSAILRLIGRMHDEALKYEGTQLYVACLEGIMSHKPATLYEVLQTSLLFSICYEIGLENSRSIGQVDCLYEPYYRADIASGRYTHEELCEMLRYFLNTYSAIDRWAGQPMCLGGSNADGEYMDTYMTNLLLDIYDELDIYNPKIHIRYHKNMPQKLLRKVLEMIRHGHSSLVLVNDEVVYKGYERIGISREESQSYIPMGCYEPVLLGGEEASICASWIGIPKAVELTINKGKDMLTGNVNGVAFDNDPQTYKEFFLRFLVQLDSIINKIINAIESEFVYQDKISPSALYSATIASCMEQAKDVRQCGMKYNNTSIKCCGIGTTVDSLMIVKKYVYEEKIISLSRLRELLLNNWQGADDLRLQILKETNRYGNGLSEPDTTAKHIYEHIAALVIGRRNNCGGVYRLGADSVMQCVDLAVNVGATPDGRFAREPFSRNMCSVTGMDREGVTANILSATAIDHSYLMNGGICDFVIHPSAVEGERGMEAFLALTRVYFERGGMALQGNVFGLEDLYAAQKEPEKYESLQVRVCGWNEYFVRMNEYKQNEFINRSRNMM